MSKHDRGSKPETTSDEWRTPLKVFRSLENHLGQTFVADMAATAENALCPQFFTKENSPLYPETANPRMMTEGAAWCNPPYASTGLEPWMKVAHRHQELFQFSWVLLVPASRSEQEWLYSVHARFYHVVFLKKRIAYLRPDGTPGKAPNHPSCAIFFPGNPHDRRRGTFSHLDWSKP